MKTKDLIIAVCLIAAIVVALVADSYDFSAETTTASTTAFDAYIPRTEELTYEEILARDPFSQVYPRNFPDDMELFLSYNLLYDEFANPGDRIYFCTAWKGESCRLEIVITETETRKREREENILIKAEELTTEHIRDSIVIELTQYKRNCLIYVDYGFLTVNYYYVSDEIDAQELFDLITSAEYYKE